MGTVLLAINGPAPDAHAMQYALDLCHRTKANLKVLQIIQCKEVGIFLRRFKQAAEKARYFFEGTMAAAAFAEEGEFDSARELMAEADRNLQSMLPKDTQTVITTKLVMSADSDEDALVKYVRENKDVVITVYDTTEPNNQNTKTKKGLKKKIQALTQQLSVPVVVVPRT